MKRPFINSPPDKLSVFISVSVQTDSTVTDVVKQPRGRERRDDVQSKLADLGQYLGGSFMY